MLFLATVEVDGEEVEAGEEGGACVAWKSADGGYVVVPGHGGHVIFGGILVILTLYWPVSVVFVAEKEWKVALVVIVFARAVQEPKSGFGLRGRH